MSDIERRLREVDRVSVPDLWDRIEAKEPRPSPPVRPRSRFPAMALALTVAATGVFFAARAFVFSSSRPASPGGLRGADVLTVPPVGEAAPEFLADGRPVFIVQHEDGTVSVIDAISTHRPWGIQQLVGWCASGRYFQDRDQGVFFNEYGQTLQGPAQAALAHFEIERIGGRVRVEPIAAPSEHGKRLTSGWEETCASPEGAYPRLLVHRIPGSFEFPSPADAVHASPEGWIAVSGELWIRSGEATILCGTFNATLHETSCTSEAPVEGVLGEELLQMNQLPEITLQGQWIARVEENHLSELTDVDRAEDDRTTFQFGGTCNHIGPGIAVAGWEITRVPLPEGALAPSRAVTVTLTNGEEFSTAAPPPGTPVTVRIVGESVAVGYGGSFGPQEAEALCSTVDAGGAP